MFVSPVHYALQAHEEGEKGGVFLDSTVTKKKTNFSITFFMFSNDMMKSTPECAILRSKMQNFYG